jgi:hypothetical protein
MPPLRAQRKSSARSKAVVSKFRWPRGICSECQKLDFSDAIFRPDGIRHPTGLIVGVLKSTLSNQSECKFCNFVRSIRLSLEGRNNYEEHAIVAFSISKTVPLAFRFWSLRNPILRDAADIVVFGTIPQQALETLSPGSSEWANN